MTWKTGVPQRTDSRWWSGRHALACLVLLAGPACATTYYGTAEAWDTNPERAMPANRVGGIEVEARQGDIGVEAAPGDSVLATARVGRAKTWGPVSGSCPEAADGAFAIVSDLDNGHLTLSLEPEPGDECVVRWELRVPARLAVTARMTAGDIEVSGVRGGLQLRTGTGDVRVHVPEGDVFARAQVGSVRVWSQAPSHREATLATQVGDVELTLEGHRFERRRPVGAGDALSLSGTGTDRLDLKSHVGDVFLALRDPGEGRGDAPER